MNKIVYFDHKIIRFINDSFSFRFLEIINIVITYLGSDVFALGLLLAIALLPQETFRPFALHSAVALLMTTITVQAIKFLIKRPRPFEVFPDIHAVKIGTDQYSFPSGHTSAAFALAVSLVLLSHNALLSSLYLFLALCVAFSRVYLRVHFPSDVILGALIGTGFAFIVNFIIF